LTIIGHHSRKSVEVLKRKPNESGGGFHNDPQESYEQVMLFNSLLFIVSASEIDSVV
jgi:hypothetical protein